MADHTEQMAAAAQHHTERMADHTEQMAAAAQHHTERMADHTEQMAAAAQHHTERMEAAAQHHRDCLLLCYACAALCVCAILGQMYICYDTRERMKGINETIDKKLAPMNDTIDKVKELHTDCA